MEASMAHCLRMRPASLLSRPSVFRPSYAARASLRYSSTDNPSGDNPLKSQPQTEDQQSGQSSSTQTAAAAPEQTQTEFKDVLGKLDFQYHGQPRNRTYIHSHDPSRDRSSLELSQEITKVQEERGAPRPENVRRAEFKLGPELGRQVIVEPERGFDLNAALKQLQVNCSTNRVRSQKTAQKFHVRRGQMIKDLRRYRWRKLFKFSFVKTVDKVDRMRRQGW